MGEKEIKPADPKPQSEIPGYPDELRTRVRPGTGTNPPPKPSANAGGGRGGRPSSSGSGTYSGHVEFEDGYRMGRDESGNTFLQHPDGGRATWDSGSETWNREGGGTASNDWTAGHRPTDFGPKH